MVFDIVIELYFINVDAQIQLVGQLWQMRLIFDHGEDAGCTRLITVKLTL